MSNDPTTSVIDEIFDERVRQVMKEGWTAEHDDAHGDGELADAAACYLRPDLRAVRERMGGHDISDPWPWWDDVDVSGGRGDCPVWGKEKAWWKPKDRRRDLIRAAALIVAEIERLDRAAAKVGAE